jgi:hypothetical protein
MVGVALVSDRTWDGGVELKKLKSGKGCSVAHVYRLANG